MLQFSEERHPLCVERAARLPCARVLREKRLKHLASAFIARGELRVRSRGLTGSPMLLEPMECRFIERAGSSARERLHAHVQCFPVVVPGSRFTQRVQTAARCTTHTLIATARGV